MKIGRPNTFQVQNVYEFLVKLAFAFHRNFSIKCLFKKRRCKLKQKIRSKNCLKQNINSYSLINRFKLEALQRSEEKKIALAINFCLTKLKTINETILRNTMHIV